MSINGDAMLFQAPMVRALWEGRKTQTRRLLYGLRKGDDKAQMRATYDRRYEPPLIDLAVARTHYYDLNYVIPAGDRIWVRETWRADIAYDELKPSHLDPKAALWFEAHDGHLPFVGNGVRGKLRPSIFLPRWASRMTLPVRAVRIERLQDISAADAIAEGLIQLQASRRWVVERGDQYFGFADHDPRKVYRSLWERINGPESWAKNPWIIVYTFDVLKQNIDETR